MNVTDDDISDSSLCRQIGEGASDIQFRVFKAILLKHKHTITNAFYRWRLLAKSRLKGQEI